MNSKYINLDETTTINTVSAVTDEIKKLGEILTDAEKKLESLERSKIKSDKAHRDLVKTVTEAVVAQQEVNVQLQDLYKESKQFAKDQDTKLFEEFKLRERLYISSMKKIFIGMLIVAGVSTISLIISLITLFL